MSLRRRPSRPLTAALAVAVTLPLTAWVMPVMPVTTAAEAAPAAGTAGSVSGAGSGSGSVSGSAASARPAAAAPFRVTPLATYRNPWAASFLGRTGYLAITERTGRLVLRSTSGRQLAVSGLPRVATAGQGGLGDVLAHPGYNGTTNRTVYLSWAEPGTGGRSGAAVGRATLVIAPKAASARLSGLQVIWRQYPKTTGSGHFSHRLAIDPSRRYLFVSSGDRQKMTPAQDLRVTLGKIVRLSLSGRAAPGNPFAARGGVSAQIWSYGHRNPLGLAFDGQGRLWSSEMGPKGGDELNLIARGRNYGWPKASNGSHYDGRPIPDHRAGDGFVAPRAWWNPSISPGGLMIYSGARFPAWRGDTFVPALSGQGLARVDLQGTTARKANFWPMGKRIREVEQGPDGYIYLLEDGPSGRLLRLTPR